VVVKRESFTTIHSTRQSSYNWIIVLLHAFFRRRKIGVLIPNFPNSTRTTTSLRDGDWLFIIACILSFIARMVDV
jgi:hypothetical protein